MSYRLLNCWVLCLMLLMAPAQLLPQLAAQTSIDPEVLYAFLHRHNWLRLTPLAPGNASAYGVSVAEAQLIDNVVGAGMDTLQALEKQAATYSRSEERRVGKEGRS